MYIDGGILAEGEGIQEEEVLEDAGEISLLSL